ncbi:MAG: [protein-PII] uridylyltransferase [Gammaproteobacteria bacterium]|nr:[protein-PII] uridylyltransferase [Gammaproteobacteria bacterium]
MIDFDTQALRRRIATADENLAEKFFAGGDAEELVRERARFIDAFLAEIWQHWFEDNDNLALFAVGGYGRGELHPKSDIDLLILIKRPRGIADEISAFVRLLWDLKLDIGHSVRTVKDCRREAAHNATVVTALMERRRLAGSQALQAKLDRVMAKKSLWPSQKYFRAKRDEQLERHSRFENVDYDLEPNIKGSPGGLRDIQTIGWITLRHLGTSDLSELTTLGFLTPQERDWLIDGRRFLFKVRFGLHIVAGRKEDRLLFDYQRTLASRLGYVDSSAQLAVEQFMHDYYRHVLALREVNDILLQHFDEEILRFRGKRKIESINERFRINNNYIEITHARVFDDTPAALLEIFVVMANRRDIAGVRATTIRSIREHLVLIDDDFRNNPEVTKLFLDLLKAPYTLVSQLTRMRRYGVLGRYIPEYGDVIGQMQHDLFHIYTVDAHTMMVIRQMRRFHYRSSQERFPVACHAVRNIPKIELLYIAGIFHDIGKGRGGDHSELGAHDVIPFCRRHHISDADTELVYWLVRQHLVMSTTAQRKDIHDPEVVLEFARDVRTQTRLDYLYALTVADINATNPTLWNSWRATLMRQLYNETRKALRRGLESPVYRTDYIKTSKKTALDKLEERGINEARVLELWDNPDDEFFLRHTPMQIVAITTAISKHDVDDGPLVLLLDLVGQVSAEGATEIFLYSRDQPHLFATSVMALGELGLQIFEASINTSAGDLAFNSYIVLDEDDRPLGNDVARRQHIRATLAERLRTPTAVVRAQSPRVSRRLKQFIIPTEVTLTNTPDANQSTLQVIAADRPGLLALIGRLFIELDIAVHSAHITTLGERVEDYFLITDQAQSPITNADTIALITSTIRDELDTEIAESAA